MELPANDVPKWLLGVAVGRSEKEIERIETALEIVTNNGAAALNLSDYGIAPGLPARCMILNGATPYEVLLNQSPVLASVRDGRCLLQRATTVNTVAGWA